MNSFSRRFLFAAGAAFALVSLVACEREGIRVSLQPKDTPDAAADSSATASDEPAAPPHPERPHAHLTWTLPSGWEETEPDQMSVASFRINGDNGQATVKITPLPDLSGKEALIVNMWREQVGAPPLSPEEAAKTLTEVDVAGGKGQLFEISGDAQGKPTRIVTAIAQAANASWFYKLSGDDALVSAQKPAFLEFLKSVRVEEPPADKSAGKS